MSDKTVDPVIPAEGRHVLHLFYKIEYAQWQLFNRDEQLRAKTTLSTLVQDIRATPDTQLLLLSIVSPKADLGFMLLTPDLHTANLYEKRLTQALGPDVCTSVFSYFSMTEKSEYTTSEADFAESLRKEKEPDSPEYETALGDFRARTSKYLHDRLYPNLPDWPVVCFYPMNKRRGDGRNWYALPRRSRRSRSTDLRCIISRRRCSSRPSNRWKPMRSSRPAAARSWVRRSI